MAMTVVDPVTEHTGPRMEVVQLGRRVCAGCGKSQVRLYRKVPAVKSQPNLYCADCAANKMNITLTSMQADGSRMRGCELTYAIGPYVPAIPIATNDGYWPLESDAKEFHTAFAEWKNLPVR